MAYRDGGDAWLDEASPLDDSPDRAVICQPVQAMEKMVNRVPASVSPGRSFVEERSSAPRRPRVHSSND